MQVAFNTAGEEAWGIGGNINFATLGAPGLTAAAVYASGTNRINAKTGASIPNRDETNIRADYAFRQGNPARRAGRDVPLFVAASGRVAADGAAIARLPQLRRPLLT